MAMDDMSQFLGVFLDESNEQLEILERDLLELEAGASDSVLQEIFRAAHTLKGSSRTMGFLQMGDLTHAMEDVFEALVHGQLTVTTSIADALLKALDLLKVLVAEAADNGAPTSDTTDVTQEVRTVLAACLSGTSSNDLPITVGKSAEAQPATSLGDSWCSIGSVSFERLATDAETAAKDAIESGMQVYAIAVSIATDCQMKSIRATMALQQLEIYAAILATTPSEEELDTDDFGEQFGAIVATDSTGEQLEKALLGVSEIVSVSALDVTQRLSGEAQAEDIVVEAVVQHEELDVATDLAVVAADQAAVPAALKSVNQSQTVRVDVTRLDNLMNLVGELVIDQTRIADLASQLESEMRSSPVIESLRETAEHFSRVAGEMQEQIMRARMLPIETMLNRFPRMVRDIAQNLGKEVDLVITGKETELDRSVLEVIGDPLIHILRNSVDHGIEPPDVRDSAGKPRKGTVSLRASHKESHIVLEIEDDGKGIDASVLRRAAVAKGFLSEDAANRLSERESVNLIFSAGFSTAAQVSDISGRGVGMDIVRSNLVKVGATIDIDTVVGKGTRFTIKLPLTLAIIRGLLVRVGTGVFAVPLASVVESILVSTSELRTVNRRSMVLHRGNALPVVGLRSILYGDTSIALDANGNPCSEEPVIVVASGEKMLGVAVDELLGEQEIVIKSLGNFVGDVKCVSGATLLGNGRIALILDVNTVVQTASEERVEAHAA
jgi:two-component system chemotaxis sensor kinase CheA